MTRWVRSQIVFVVLTVPLAARAGGNPVVVLQAGSLALGFDGATGRVVSIDDSVSHRAWLDPAGLAVPLWEIVCQEGRHPTIRPEDASAFVMETHTAGTALRAVWSEFDDFPGLRVEATAKADDGSVAWGLSIKGVGGLSIREVRYPRIGPLARMEGETLAVPQWMGEASRTIRTRLNPEGHAPEAREWAYPGLLSMQVVSWSSGGDGEGLWLSAEDAKARHKRMAVRGDGQGGVSLEVIHLPEQDAVANGAYGMPYAVRLGQSGGGWFGASQAYGRWARSQAWVSDSRLKRSLSPAWMRDTGLWVWNRGRSPGVLGPAERLQTQIGPEIPVSVFWHWWHGCAYDAGFPEYLPPREGTGLFTKAVAEAHDAGLHAIVYMNQRLWGMTTASWKDQGAKRLAVKGPDGTVRPEVYNTFTKAPCASMCMGTPFWRETYAGLAAEAINGLGVDGIYMDQACSSLACYDASHPHPAGGGTYWMEGFRALEADIRHRANRPVGLAGEGCGESWLPHLDAMLSLQVSLERYAAPGEWEPIPMFHAVYHDCALFYGNYASLTRPPYDDLWPSESAPADRLKLLDRKFDRQFRLEQARAFCWGQQPTIANVTDEVLSERGEEVAFAVSLARLRMGLLPFLRDGRMLAPIEVDVEPVTIPMSRLSIYAGQQGAVQEFAKAVVLVMASAWQAPDGRIAIVAVNLGDDPVTVNLPLPPEAKEPTLRTELPAAGGRAWVVERKNSTD
jgi:hypothetical protein